MSEKTSLFQKISLVLACSLLVLASIAKTDNFAGFITSVKYHIGYYMNPYEMGLLLIIEIGLPIWLLTGWRFRQAVMLLTVLYALFSIYHVHILMSGAAVPCSCMGSFLTTMFKYKSNAIVDALIAWVPFMLLLNAFYLNSTPDTKQEPKATS